MQILVPLAGRSDFFSPDQYFFPKPLIEVGGKTMIERVIENLTSVHPNSHFIFIVHQEDIARFSLDKTLSILTDGCCSVIGLTRPTKGALCSAMLAVDLLDPDAPVIVANGDQIIDCDFGEVLSHFEDTDADAGIIAFPSVHPRWSYAQISSDGFVFQATEKEVISRTAIAGFYYFKTASLFVRCATRCLQNDTKVNGNFYVSFCLNEVTLGGGRVSAFMIPVEAYHSLYSPEKVRTFEDDAIKKSLFHLKPVIGNDAVNLIVPAAGQGSRFAVAGFKNPKPFIDVHGQPMIAHVIENVRPTGAHVHVLLRTEHIDDQRPAVDYLEAAGCTIHKVDRLTEGTACTLLLARPAFDNDSPMLVANSDQYVEFDVDAYVADCKARNLDGSILVFRDETRNPKWSFARIDSEGLVTEVAEKKAISDLATVGIYLFRKGSDFVRGAIDMIALNERVNNEFYTAPVYNYLIKAGLKIGVYEVPMSAMHGLGTPDDLREFLTKDLCTRNDTQ